MKKPNSFKVIVFYLLIIACVCGVFFTENILYDRLFVCLVIILAILINKEYHTKIDLHV